MRRRPSAVKNWCKHVGNSSLEVRPLMHSGVLVTGLYVVGRSCYK